MYPAFTAPAGTTIYIPFATYAGTTGASVTMTNFAVTDIEIYKNGSTTQRSSDAGVALLDTDGTDFDGVTGLHGFSIDLSDNTDAGFYAAGSWYWVVVSVVTVDSQTVTFIAAMFRIVAAESTAGTPKADVSLLAGSAIDQTGGLINANVKQISTDATAADNAEAFFDGSGYAGTNNVIPLVTTTTTATNVTTVNGLAANVITAASINADAITDAKVAADVTIASVTGAVGSVTGAVGSVTGAVGSVTGAVGSVTGNVGGNVTGSVGSLAAQAKADVNAEVLDVLNTDTFAEPGQEAPGATVSLVKKIGYLYKAWRNKVTQTSTTYSLYADDAATVDQKATLSDDATTFTSGEKATGP